MLKTIATEQAPRAIGPYSQAVIWQGLAFLSGQIPLDPATNQIVEGDIAAQTERVLENLKAVLEACGSSLARVLKTTVYLKDMSDGSSPRKQPRFSCYLADLIGDLRWLVGLGFCLHLTSLAGLPQELPGFAFDQRPVWAGASP